MELGRPTQEVLDKLLDLLSDYKRRRDLHEHYDEAMREHGHDLIWAAIDKRRIIDDAKKFFELWDQWDGATTPLPSELTQALATLRGRILYSQFAVANLPESNIDWTK